LADGSGQIGVSDSTGHADQDSFRRDLHFDCTGSRSEEIPARGLGPERAASRLETTRRSLAMWSALHQRTDVPWRELLPHGGRVLSGGFVLTAKRGDRRGRHHSLPRSAGGERLGLPLQPGYATVALHGRACGSPRAQTRRLAYFAFLTTVRDPPPFELPGAPYHFAGFFVLSTTYATTLPTLRVCATWPPFAMGNGAW